jgi:hypothetical protein
MTATASPTASAAAHGRGSASLMTIRPTSEVGDLVADQGSRLRRLDFGRAEKNTIDGPNGIAVSGTAVRTARASISPIATAAPAAREHHKPSAEIQIRQHQG